MRLPGNGSCLEAEASMLVVSKKAIEGIEQGRITSLKQIDEAHSKQMGDAIMEAANNGDQYAIELFSDAGYKIGKALAILIHIMNPQAIVLSGRGAKVGKILLVRQSSRHSINIVSPAFQGVPSY